MSWTQTVNWLREPLIKGTIKGLKTTLFLISIMVPLSFLMVLLKWSGFLQVISDLIAPLFKYVGLPGSCSLAYMSGMLLNCYSGIAVMITIPLTAKQITICSLMILIAHNIPVESAIQKKTGSSALFIIMTRLFFSLAAGILLNHLMPESAAYSAGSLNRITESALLGEMLLGWFSSSFILILKIMVIVVLLMIFHELLEKLNIIRTISKIIYPIMLVLGLSKNAATLWIISNTLGLAYGGGVLVSYVREKKIKRDEFKRLNISIAICHSIVEDTILFVAIGASLFWIVVPRVLLAGLAVWTFVLFTGIFKHQSNHGG